jgi:rhamnogalacturonan endolyase
VDAAIPYKGEGSTETESNGYIGKGYFDFKNSTSSFATWLVKSPKEDSITLSIRYANGDSVSRDMELVVNDKEIGIVKMGKTGSWSAWNTSSVKIKLKKGKNSITLKSTVKSGGANVDAFLFDIAGVEAYKNSESLPVVQFGSGFYYRPATGALFSPVSGFVEILFYDVSGTMRAAISSHVTVGENEVVLDRGVLSKGMYVVKVKLDGKLMQKGLFNKMNN